MKVIQKVVYEFGMHERAIHKWYESFQNGHESVQHGCNKTKFEALYSMNFYYYLLR